MTDLMTDEQRAEWLACAESPIYFVHSYCQIYDATIREWIPFHLWREQAQTLKAISDNLLVIILKARQLGLTWLVLCFALWLMVFRPAATVLLFSRRDDEAVHLLDFRLKGVYERLPEWMRARGVTNSSKHELTLSNGSVALCFPTTAGDSYTATLAIVDEADLVTDLGRLMRAVKPTIDGGGGMILLSRSDKTKPNSEFKRIYRAAKERLSQWVSVFLPWWVRPERDEAWYEAQRTEIEARTGSVDDLHEQYPATDTEALSPRTLDKRIPSTWLERCYRPVKMPARHELPPGAPNLSQLEIYLGPIPGNDYVIGVDPAEGNPTSDDSALTVVHKDTGEEVAALAGRIQPSVMASYVNDIAIWYNEAEVMVERNNHGHAVLLWLGDNTELEILVGRDGRPGWHSTSLGKALLYNACADAFRDEETVLHSFATFTQLASIEGATLRAPAGERDDRADSYALAILGRTAQTAAGTLEFGVSPIAGYRGQ